MSWFYTLSVLGAGVLVGGWLARRFDPLHRLARNPAEGRRLRDLEARIRLDRKGVDTRPRLELCAAHLERRDPRAAGRALGQVIASHPDQAQVRELARRSLRGMLLHELRGEGERPTALMPQDLNWHPGSKRVVMRLRDLTLGGLVQLKHLELHIDDFEPLMRTQPLPRVVACQAVIGEEQLGFVLDSRIDWSQTPLQDFRVLFREGRIHILGTVRFGVPIGFRITAVARFTGTSRLELSFPHPPRVAGLVPLPIDTVLKIVQRKLEEKLPGAVTSTEEATLEVDILKAGVPPVELNLREIRIGDGRFEILCAAEGYDVEALEVLRLPPPGELLGAPGGDEDEDAEISDEREFEDESDAAAPAAPGGFMAQLRGLFGGRPEGPAAAAVRRAEELRASGELGAALQVLLAAMTEVRPQEPSGAGLCEALAELRLDIGGEDNRVLARELLEAVLERHPDRPKASLLLARALDEMGEHEAAEDRARVAALLAPFDEEAYRLLEGLLERRGASRAAGRAREIHRALHLGRLPAPDDEDPAEPRAVLFAGAFERLRHPDERSATGRLVESLQGCLAWLDPRPDPGADGRRAWPLSADEFPRLAHTAGALARALQVTQPQLVVVDEGQGGFVTRGGASPWIEAAAGSLPALDERALAFELARCLHQVRTGRGFLGDLGEDELDLLYALLRAVAEEAHRVESRSGGLTGRTLERIIEDTVDTLAQGWVIRADDLDPYVPRDVRVGAREAALDFQAEAPTYRALQAWQWSLEASADRTGLLFAGSVGACLRALRVEGGAVWDEVEAEGLGTLASRVSEDRSAYRVRELFGFAIDPVLEELERELFS